MACAVGLNCWVPVMGLPRVSYPGPLSRTAHRPEVQGRPHYWAKSAVLWVVVAHETGPERSDGRDPGDLRGD